MPGEGGPEPGGGGDPVITKFDGQTFKFGGSNGVRYNLLTAGEFRVLCRVAVLGGVEDPPTYFAGCDVLSPEGASVTARNDGTILYQSGEWSLRIDRKFCTFPIDKHPDRPKEPAQVIYTTPGKCELYVGLSEGVNLFHAGIKSQVIAYDLCSLDAPGHFGKTTDSSHPLQGIAHLNVRVAGRPKKIQGVAGLMVDGDRPDANPADYAVAG